MNSNTSYEVYKGVGLLCSTRWMLLQCSSWECLGSTWIKKMKSKWKFVYSLDIIPHSMQREFFFVFCYSFFVSVGLFMWIKSATPASFFSTSLNLRDPLCIGLFGFKLMVQRHCHIRHDINFRDLKGFMVRKRRFLKHLLEPWSFWMLYSRHCHLQTEKFVKKGIIT